MVATRQTKELIADLRRCGFQVKPNGNGHYRVRTPDGRGPSVNISDSDRNGTLLAQLKDLSVIGYTPTPKAAFAKRRRVVPAAALDCDERATHSAVGTRPVKAQQQPGDDPAPEHPEKAPRKETMANALDDSALLDLIRLGVKVASTAPQLLIVLEPSGPLIYLPSEPVAVPADWAGACGHSLAEASGELRKELARALDARIAELTRLREAVT